MDSVSVVHVETCRSCGGRTRCHGGQSLVGDVLHWGIERSCPACGGAEAVWARATSPTTCGGVSSPRALPPGSV